MEDQIYYTCYDASGNKFVANNLIFQIKIQEKEKTKCWEKLYSQHMNNKYKKNTRNFSKKITAIKTFKNPPIYIIARERGGPSYKDVNCIDSQGNEVKSEDIQFAPISKGYSMQNVSSFTLGPVVDHGLCVVNSAFSKGICIFHVEGGGKVNLKRKNFWQPSKTPKYKISYINDLFMKVDNKEMNILEWLKEHKTEWFDEWLKWSKSIALCSEGDFHWLDASLVLTYFHNDKYLDFVTWKKECYIKPAYKLIVETDVYKFLCEVREKGKALGLVHPKGKDTEKLKPLTKEYIENLFNDPYEMAYMPYVVAGLLLGVKIFFN